MGVTMKEIAYMCGVSRGTVDRVLNKRGSVNPQTAEKILEIAQALDYKPNRAGLVLAAQKKNLKLGVILFGEGNPFFDEVRHTIESGRIINNFSFAEGNDTREVERRMNETVRDMLTGKITVDEWFTIIDKARDDYLSGKSTYVPEVYGTCEEEFSKLDTALLIGQIYRDAADADIGLVFVNTTEQGANCRIYKGNIDAAVMRHMAPDRTSGEGEGVAYAMLKGQQIIDCLNGLEEFPGQFNVCYYVASGLDVEFAPWMPVGSRLISCKLPDGTPIDPEKSYKTAFFSDKLYYNVDGEFAVYRPEDMQLAEGKWHDIFIKWIADHNNVLKRPEQTTILNWKTLQ